MVRKPKSEQARYAPLLLLPVEIIRRSAQKGTLFWASFVQQVHWWNDIHNNADRLSENKIVKSLASGKLEWESDGLPTTSDLDGSYLPSEIALPISADATQLDAICAAAQNKNFILHGPPGTGKSQTITTIIANALYQGKKVLFVAEKMAALNKAKTKQLASLSQHLVSLPDSPPPS